ncbi:hypothetical protein, partial [Rhizobium tropici]|uniref:hypothetical protein n=1 Tax=Rhizobium tropici TaxID=398 RepID=UPI001AEEEED1
SASRRFASLKVFSGQLAQPFRKEGIARSLGVRQKMADVAKRNAAVIHETYPCLRSTQLQRTF